MSLFRVEGATPDENDESKEHSLAARLAAVRLQEACEKVEGGGPTTAGVSRGVSWLTAASLTRLMSSAHRVAIGV